MSKKLIRDSSTNFKVSDNVIALCVFGSYLTDNWVEGQSDIDVMVLYRKTGINQRLLDESLIKDLCITYFNYTNIHVTFLEDYMLNIFEEMRRSPDRLILQRDEFNEFWLNRSRFIRLNLGHVVHSSLLYEEVLKDVKIP